MNWHIAHAHSRFCWQNQNHFDLQFKLGLGRIFELFELFELFAFYSNNSNTINIRIGKNHNVMERPNRTGKNKILSTILLGLGRIFELFELFE